MRWRRARPPIDADEFDWLLACFAWLLRKLDPDEPFRQSEVFLPASEDRPIRDHDDAEALFVDIRRTLGMSDWPCRLVPQERRNERYLGGTKILQSESNAPLGTFGLEGDAPVITYDPDLLRSRSAMTATLVHELAHYLLDGLDDPPGGADLSEHATDAAGVYLGFGVYLANAAFNFGQFSDGEIQGWERRATGYLSELALITATAICVHCTNADVAPIRTALKPYLRGPFDRALAAVRDALPEKVESLRSIDLSEWR